MFSTWWERRSTVPCNVYKNWIKQSLYVAETNTVSSQAKLFAADATKEQRILQIQKKRVFTRKDPISQCSSTARTFALSVTIALP